MLFIVRPYCQQLSTNCNQSPMSGNPDFTIQILTMASVVRKWKLSSMEVPCLHVVVFFLPSPQNFGVLFRGYDLFDQVTVL